MLRPESQSHQHLFSKFLKFLFCTFWYFDLCKKNFFFSILIKKLTKFRFTKVNSAVIIKVLKKMYILVCVLCLIDSSVLLIKN